MIISIGETQINAEDLNIGKYKFHRVLRTYSGQETVVYPWNLIKKDAVYTMESARGNYSSWNNWSIETKDFVVRYKGNEKECIIYNEEMEGIVSL